MSTPDRKSLSREYKETPRPAGLYIVRNTRSGKSLIGSTPDLPGMLNRLRFQLVMGSYPDTDLQADWDTLGPEAFEIEVLDRLEPQPDPTLDQTEDLRALLTMWLDKLGESGVEFYRRPHRGA